MDELLIRRAQEGDPDAFERLMTPLEGMVWRICWHYMGERESASDCAQEAMLRIWRGLGSYRGDCSFESWIYRIAANCCLDQLRKNKRDRNESIEPLREQGFDPPDPSPGTEEQVIMRERKAKLREGISLLPKDQRDALVLTQLEGISYERTAEMLQITVGTVKSRVNRARSRLREWLEDGKGGLPGEQLSGKDVQQKERRGSR